MIQVIEASVHLVMDEGNPIATIVRNEKARKVEIHLLALASAGEIAELISNTQKDVLQEKKTP